MSRYGKTYPLGSREAMKREPSLDEEYYLAGSREGKREKGMKTMAKMFSKKGFEGIWRVESKRLDIYTIDDKGVQHFLRTKELTSSWAAETYFKDKVKNRPVLQFADTSDDDHLS